MLRTKDIRIIIKVLTNCLNYVNAFPALQDIELIACIHDQYYQEKDATERSYFRSQSTFTFLVDQYLSWLAKLVKIVDLLAYYPAKISAISSALNTILPSLHHYLFSLIYF